MRFLTKITLPPNISVELTDFKHTYLIYIRQDTLHMENTIFLACKWILNVRLRDEISGTYPFDHHLLMKIKLFVYSSRARLWPLRAPRLMKSWDPSQTEPPFNSTAPVLNILYSWMIYRILVTFTFIFHLKIF